MVRSLSVSNSEQIFVSTSKDKLAKVWKLGNHGSGSSKVSCQLTYSGHSKTVSGAKLMEEMGHVVSCDGSVHVSGSLRQFKRGGWVLLLFLLSRCGT